MGECSWSRELARATVNADDRGRLVKLTLQGGSSTDEHDKIAWQPTPHDVYVFCSLTLPSVMLNADDGWQVDVLDFINGVPGVLESSEAIYIQTCHPDDRDFPNNAAALGYNAIPEDRQDVSIKTPADIFTLATE